MDMPQYEIGKVVFGSSAKIAAAYERFSAQEIDEVRLAPDRSSPFRSADARFPKKCRSPGSERSGAAKSRR